MAKYILVVALALVAVALAADTDKYDSKYDNVDVDEVLHNDRLLIPYFKCMVGKGSCATSEAKFLKQVVPDALTNACSRCTEKQQVGADKVIRYIVKNKPDMWTELKAKFDPEGVYFEKYREEAKKRGVEV